METAEAGHMPSARILRLIDKLVDCEGSAPEWMLLMYESLRTTEGEPMVLRRAEAFAHILEKLPVEIEDDEMLVGRLPNHAPSEDDKKALREAEAYFREHNLLVGLRCLIEPHEDPELRSFVDYDDNGLFLVRRLYHHVAPDGKKLLTQGFGQIEREIQERLADRSLSAEQRVFLEASLLTVRTAKSFILRYADLASEQASKCSSEARKEELRTIERICRRIASGPASTFREAIQLAWFQFFLMCIEIADVFHASGFELDRLLIDFYRGDTAAGRLTRGEASELVSHLFLNMNIPNPRSNILPLTVGGMDSARHDASNELTDICLEVCEDLELLHPSLALRCHTGMPRRLFEKAVGMWANGRGYPQLLNDDVVIPSLLESGVREEDAYEWIHSVCNEITVVGKTNGWISSPYFNMAKPLDLVLNNGRSLLNGRQLGGDRGSLADHADFESLYKAYCEELAHWIEVSVRVQNRCEKSIAASNPHPFLSANVDGCIEKARDYTDGGPVYNPSYIQGTGISTAVDSLIVLRDLVFGEGRIPAAELLGALRNDFRGYESLRASIRKYGIKYGNDIHEADSLFVRLAEFFYDEVRKHENTRGGRYYPGFMVFTSHEVLGLNTGATPDGRHARTALSDSVGAVQGMDRQGVTALFSSVTKSDYVPAVGGVTFNVRLGPAFFKPGESFSKLVSAVRTYLDMGGFQIQANMVDGKLLQEAQAHPELHRGLMVRVGGFSAYFTELAKELQNEIMQRTEHCR